jgi:hypothetical protein
LNSPVAGLQSRVFCPGTPNIRSIVASLAELRPLLKVSLEGIGTMSPGLGEEATVARAGFGAGFFFAAAFAFVAMDTSRGDGRGEQPSTAVAPRLPLRFWQYRSSIPVHVK